MSQSAWTVDKEGDIVTIRTKELTRIFVFPEGTNMRLPEAICALHNAESSAKNAALDAEREDARLFGEIMAVMNGDGGHYQSDYGSKAAFDRALATWHERFQRMDNAETQLLAAEAAISEHNKKWQGRWPSCQITVDLSALDAAVKVAYEKGRYSWDGEAQKPLVGALEAARQLIVQLTRSEGAAKCYKAVKQIDDVLAKVEEKQ